MSKKRRVFDIEMPDDSPGVPAGTGPMETKSATPARRGPMASAIGETADSLRRRKSQEAAIREENDALAHEFVRLKKSGLIVDLVPLEKIRTDKLTRDRAVRPDEDLKELIASIREIGLSNPIQLEATDNGDYELIQGFRRLSAYRALLEETGDDVWARIPAGLVASGEALEGLYRRMVDENMVRKDISFAEMASLARAYVDDPATQAEDVEEAVATLFKSAGRQKRSYIRHFATLLQFLEKYLEFPEAIPRALGLALVKRMEQEPGSIAEIVKALQAGPVRDATQQVDVLRRYLDGQGAAAHVSPQGQRSSKPRSAKSTFRMMRPEGEAKCTASDGRLEVQLNRDFSALERNRLEAAVSAFFERLDGAD